VGVKDTISAVCAFASEGEFRAFAIELRPPLDEFLDALGSILDQHSRRFRIAEAIAGVERVLLVEADFVFVAEGYGNSALRPCSGGIAEIGFGEDQNAAGAAEFNGGAQTGDARAYYCVIGLVGGGRGSHGRFRVNVFSQGFVSTNPRTPSMVGTILESRKRAQREAKMRCVLELKRFL